MTTALFVLRLISAFALLGVVGVMIWLVYRDMRLTADMFIAQTEKHGHLLVIHTESTTIHANQTFDLLPVTGIGRAATNTIMLDDDYASGEHALITQRGQQWWAQDLGSSNGTLLNNEPLSRPITVMSGDVITIGSTELRLEF